MYAEFNNKEIIKNIRKLYVNNFWYNHRKKILKYIHKQYNNTVYILDLGAGIGVDKDVLKHAIALEIDKFNIKLNLYEKIICADAQCLPFKNNSFDIVSCMNLLEHRDINVKRTLDEINRVLKKNGIVYINVPMFNFLFSKHDIAVNNSRRFNRVQLKRLIRKYFIIEFISYWNFFLIPFIIFKRKIIDYFINNTGSDIIELPNFINNLFKFLLLIEIPLFKKELLPFGISLFIVLRKKQ